MNAEKKALIVTRVSGFVPQFEMNNVHILQEMGYEVHYAANYQNIVYGNNNARLVNTGIVRHHIPFIRSPFSPETWRCYKRLLALILKENFDLIHCHMPITGILTRMAAHKAEKLTGRHIPTLYTAHGFHFFTGCPRSNWMYYFPEKRYARYTDHLILINKEDIGRAEKKFHVRGSIDYIPGVGLRDMPEPDTGFDLRTMYHIPPEHKIAVSVGELTELKNHITAIRAMDRFRTDPLTLIIFGQGACHEMLAGAVRTMHLEKQVVLAGYSEHIPDVLRQSDFFVFPSTREGLPVAMMEAMQAGLPVLAADIRGNHDLIEDGKGGFLFDENMASDYSRALKYFLTYPEEAKRMGEWNRERVKDFRLELVDRKMREIYAGCGSTGQAQN